MARGALALGSFAFLFSISGFAGSDPATANSDPLAAIDLHRGAIIADIVQGLQSQAAGDPLAAAMLKARLEKLRADRLLAASLASTRASLEAILGESEKPHDAAPGHASLKSLGDPNRDLVYTPLAPCRLIDTRGFGAPIQGGPFAPGERRAYVPNGLCALPTSGVASLMIAFTTLNLTPGSGGYLSIVAPGALAATTADIFNLGSQWSASNTMVATGPAAQFDVYVNTANAHVVVDVLGYFAPPQGGISISGNLTLVSSTASAGNILKVGLPFIHNFGSANTFIGVNAGNFTMTGGNNTGSGLYALQGNTTGTDNTANGSQALFSNTTGNNNTASGMNALFFNTSGSDNTASGAQALHSNTIGTNNTASGVNALLSNTTGSNDTASGQAALQSNTTGNANTATGSFALSNNTTGDGNTASGTSALQSNTTGLRNTVSGLFALATNTTGSDNIALGNQAGAGLTTGNFNIDIGSAGVAAESSTIRIGDGNQTRAFIAGIRGVASGVNDAIPVLVDSQGQLGTASSSRRFKDNIVDMDSASSALMRLRPVTFHYKSDQNPAGRRLQYGLIAEEVTAVYPGLVVRSADGQVETVMYQFLPAMLLNEYQKQQRTIERQATEMIRQAAELALQTAEIARQRQLIAELVQDRQLQSARLDALERMSIGHTARMGADGK